SRRAVLLAPARRRRTPLRRPRHHRGRHCPRRGRARGAPPRALEQPLRADLVRRCRLDPRRAGRAGGRIRHRSRRLRRRRRGDGAARAPPRRRRRIRDHVRAPAPLARADLQGGRPMNAQPLSLPQATYLVAEREVTTRVRSKAFIISTLILLIGIDRKSTRLNSSHVKISYAVFCLKKKTSSNKNH